MGVIWKNEFSIGIYEIDSQHQELFARLDRFISAIEQGIGASQVAQLLDFLDDYSKRHFMAEELLQKQIDYPHLAMHESEHASFLVELKRLRKRLDEGGATPRLAHLAQEVLEKWLIQHICKIDKVLGVFFNEHRQAEWEQYLKDHF